MSEASKPTTFAAVFFVIRPFVLPRTMLPGSLMNQLWWWMRWHNWAWSTSCFRHWGIGIRKIIPFKWYNFKGRKGLCFIIFPNLEMTKRSSHPDHQLTRSQFCSHPWCWERLHFGDIFTSKVISWRFLDITLVPCEDTSTCFVCPKKTCHWKVETVRFQVTHPPSKKEASNLHGFPDFQVYRSPAFPRHSRSSFILGF